MPKCINYQFKVLIFFGIVFVVCGHLGNPLLTIGGMFQYDSFHMSLFMFISGYFFYANTFLSDLLKNINRLFIPFIYWNIIYLLILTYFKQSELWSFTMGKELSFPYFLSRTITIGDASVLNVPSWFLMTLFLVKTTYLILRNFFTIFFRLNEHHFLILLFIIAVLGIRISNVEMNFEAKIALSRMMYLMFWYGFGFYFNRYLESFFDRITNLVYFLLIFIIQIILLFISKGESKSIIFSAKFTIPVPLVFLFSLMAILFWLRVSKILTPYVKNNKILLYISDHTFDIMMHHGIFLKMYMGIYWALSYYYSAFSTFNVDKFREHIWYNFIPYGNVVFTNINLLVGLFFPIFLVLILDRIKIIFNKIYSYYYRSLIR